MHNIPEQPAPKMDVLGPNPHNWYKFHQVKVYQTEDCYKLKKEIKQLIQEGHLKKYAKGNSAGGLGESNSQGRDSSNSVGSKKGKNPTKGGEGRFIYHAFNTILRGFARGRDTSSAQKRHACQILVIDGSPIDSETFQSETLEANITFSKKDAIDIHPHNNNPMVISVQ